MRGSALLDQRSQAKAFARVLAVSGAQIRTICARPPALSAQLLCVPIRHWEIIAGFFGPGVRG